LRALSTDDDTLGCGCDYPAYVSDTVVANSNAVVARLRAAATGERHPWLAELPRYLTVAVGERRVGIVHGDPDNLAGWSLALEAVEPQDRLVRDRSGFTGTTTTTARVLDWLRRAEVDCSAAPTPACPTRRTTRTPRAGAWS
jgi:hypothetical protein